LLYVPTGGNPFLCDELFRALGLVLVVRARSATARPTRCRLALACRSTDALTFRRLLADDPRGPRIDWKTDPTERVLPKIRAGDGSPGVLDTIAGRPFHLFGAHPERALRGRPGEMLAQRSGAICRVTIDGRCGSLTLNARTPRARGTSSRPPSARSRASARPPPRGLPGRRFAPPARARRSGSGCSTRLSEWTWRASGRTPFASPNGSPGTGCIRCASRTNAADERTTSTLRQCVFGADSSYHEARRRLVYKLSRGPRRGKRSVRLAT
jgi:hypothetical protein